MKKEKTITIPSEAPSLDALVVPCWGKANFHMVIECYSNPQGAKINKILAKPKCASSCSSCYGPKVAAFCAKEGIDDIITMYIGQNSLDILANAGISAYSINKPGLTVKEALKEYLNSSCAEITAGNAPNPGSPCGGSCSSCSSCDKD